MFWLSVHRVRPGRRRCFVCTAPSAAAAVARESCTFLDPAAVQNCRFLGEKSKKCLRSQVRGGGWGQAGCHRDGERNSSAQSSHN